jgi:transcriptional regulator with XRE-family HTH domain
MIKVADWIREQRLAEDYTQAELATLIGVAKGTISHWEGGGQSPGMPALQKLAELFEVDFRDLIRMAMDND